MLLTNRPAMHAEKGWIRKKNVVTGSFIYNNLYDDCSPTKLMTYSNCVLLYANNFLHFMFFNTCNLMNTMIFFYKDGKYKC